MKLENWLVQQRYTENNSQLWWLSKYSYSFYEFTLHYLRGFSIGRELKLIQSLFVQNHSFLFLFTLMIQTSWSILRSGSEIRSESIIAKKTKIVSLLKMLLLLSFIFLLDIVFVLLFSYSNDLSYTNNTKGVFGYIKFEKIIMIFLANEAFEALESFSITFIWLLSKFFKFNERIMKNLHLFLLQILTIVILIKLMGKANWNWEVITLLIIKSIFHFEKVASNLIAADLISSMFTVTKAEIKMYSLDKMWILCQSEMNEGILLSWNHVNL